MAAPSHLAILVLLLLSLRTHAITTKEDRHGDLSDPDSQGHARGDIEEQIIDRIDHDVSYTVGPVADFSSDLPSSGQRLHARLILAPGSCNGAVPGSINGLDLMEVFEGNMLDFALTQISQAYGFGVVAEGVHPTLLQQGLVAQFYYWVELAGEGNRGGETPKTGQGKGKSDNNPHRHDELSVREDAKGSFSSDKSRDNMTYRTQPSNVSTIPRKIGAQKQASDDCPPWNYALFTSLYDINFLASNPDYGPQFIVSPNQRFKLYMQPDCNLVVYQLGSYIGSYISEAESGPKALWACGDACYQKGTNCIARINLDGTFAVYNGYADILWFTPTQCSSGPGCWSDTYLAMQDDGNLVLYLLDTNEAIWATNTAM